MNLVIGNSHAIQTQSKGKKLNVKLTYPVSIQQVKQLSNYDLL